MMSWRSALPAFRPRRNPRPCRSEGHPFSALSLSFFDAFQNLANPCSGCRFGICPLNPKLLLPPRPHLKKANRLPPVSSPWLGSISRLSTSGSQNHASIFDGNPKGYFNLNKVHKKLLFDRLRCVAALGQCNLYNGHAVRVTNRFFLWLLGVCRKRNKKHTKQCRDFNWLQYRSLSALELIVVLGSWAYHAAPRYDNLLSVNRQAPLAFAQ